MSEATVAKQASRRGCPSSVALTRSLAIFLLLNALVLNGLIWLASPAGYKETVLQHSWDVLRGDGSDNSWGAMAIALDLLQVGRAAADLQRGLLRPQRQVPVSAVVAVRADGDAGGGAPGARAHHRRATSTPGRRSTTSLGWLFIVLTAAATAALLERRLRQRCGYDDTPALIGLRVASCSVSRSPSIPSSRPSRSARSRSGSTACSPSRCSCWATGWRAASGALIGVICLIKPHYGLFVLWALLRKEWRFAFACVAAGCAGLVGSLAVFGWTNHLDYLPVLSHLAERGETYYPNHSVNGLLNRLMSVVEPELYHNLEWGDGAFPPFNRWVYWTTTISSAAILLLAIMRRNRENDPDRVIDFCTMAVSCTVASPIAWEHHYGVLFPVFAVMLASALRSRARLPWLIVSYVLASNYFIATQLLAPTFWNFIQSYLLFATWILLVLLHLRPPLPLASANPTSADAPEARLQGTRPMNAMRFSPKGV